MTTDAVLAMAASPLWFVSDVGGGHVLGRDFAFVRVGDVTAGEWADDDGYFWAFHSRGEAQAFCNGFHACGGFARPWGRAAVLPESVTPAPGSP